MPRTLREKLMEKGWTTEEVNKAMTILGSSEAKKRSSVYRRSLLPLIYWTTLLVTIVGNIIISIVLVPFMIVLSGAPLYMVIIILGATFGLLFNLLIRDIELLDNKDHIIAGILIPALAITNVYIVVKITNPIRELITHSAIVQSPVIVSILYVASFITPYLVYGIIDFIRDRKRILMHM